MCLLSLQCRRAEQGYTKTSPMTRRQETNLNLILFCLFFQQLVDSDVRTHGFQLPGDTQPIFCVTNWPGSLMRDFTNPYKRIHVYPYNKDYEGKYLK
jgi:hypothetical protein